MEDLLPIFVIALVLIFKATLGKKKNAVPELDEEPEPGEEVTQTPTSTVGAGRVPAQNNAGRVPARNNAGRVPARKTRSTSNIQLSTKNDARRAFIYSEIFNKKYNT